MNKVVILLCTLAIVMVQACNNDKTNASSKAEAETIIAEVADKVDYEKHGIQAASADQLSELKIGDTAPSFITKDQTGKTLNLEQILKNQSVVLVFYRGYWCPYCSKYLQKFVAQLEEISAKGARVIAISPEKMDHVNKLDEMLDSKISIISDVDGSIMSQYGVAFDVTDAYNDKVNNYKGFKLEDAHDSESAVLPIPATYVIGKNGKVTWAHFDPDYSQRGSIDDILANL